MKRKMEAGGRFVRGRYSLDPRVAVMIVRVAVMIVQLVVRGVRVVDGDMREWFVGSNHSAFLSLFIQ